MTVPDATEPSVLTQAGTSGVGASALTLSGTVQMADSTLEGMPVEVENALEAFWAGPRGTGTRESGVRASERCVAARIHSFKSCLIIPFFEFEEGEWRTYRRQWR